MFITITRSVEVKTCLTCPHSKHSMDGTICSELRAFYGVDNDFVLPEGRDGIHPKCPHSNKDKW